MHTDSCEDIVFVFAHQDDEIGVLTRIRWEVSRGARVWCAYLTDGATNVPAEVRDRESSATLEHVGVLRERIAFLGAPQRIRDGRLPFEVPRALSLLRAWAASIPAIARVYTLDWEGGHHDHDAAHLVSVAFARDRGVPTVLAFAMYNGWRRRRGWFRVTSFVPGGGTFERRRLGVREALVPARAILGYPSQRRTWLGLGPGLVLRALLRREERLRHVDVQRLAQRPHEGPLLYEELFGVSAESVLGATRALRAELAASR